MTLEQPQRGDLWIDLTGTIILCWLPVAVFLFMSANPATESHAIGSAVAGVAVVIWVYLLTRTLAWSFVLWFPWVLGAAIGGIVLLMAGLSMPAGGPDAAPLEGAAQVEMLLIAVGLGGLAIGGALLRPKNGTPAGVVIGVFNTALMLIAASNGIRFVTGQEILLHLTDPSGKPLPGAIVEYERFGYGAGGAEVFETGGGPLHSDEAGVATVPSRRMRYKTRMTISKDGFRRVAVTLDMQFSKTDGLRGFSLSTLETRPIATGAVPTSDPVLLHVCLSPVTEIPSRDTVRFGLYSRRDLPKAAVPKSLDLETGKFADDLSGDLELDYFSATNTRFRDQRLRIRGLRGVRLFLVSEEKHLPAPQTLHEQLYRIAPQSGYQPEVVVSPGNTPGPTIYLRSADGTLHGRLCIEAHGDGVGEPPRYAGTLDVNPSGRNLEWVNPSD